MQEAFPDAFDKIGQFQFRSTFGAWMKRIVINKSLDAIRRHIPYEDIDEIPEPADFRSLLFNPLQSSPMPEEVKTAMIYYNTLTNNDVKQINSLNLSAKEKNKFSSLPERHYNNRTTMHKCCENS